MGVYVVEVETTWCSHFSSTFVRVPGINHVYQACTTGIFAGLRYLVGPSRTLRIQH